MKGRRSMKNLKKMISLVGCVLMAAISVGFASCGEQKPAVSTKSHDRVTLKMSDKDEYKPHNFVDGKCTMCDETTIFTQDTVSGTDVFKNACSEQGSVIEIHYDTRAYCLEAEYPDAGEIKTTKRAFVYLPYGYDAEDKSTKYDVLYLLHGSGLNEGYWFAKGTYSPQDSVYTGGWNTLNVIDNLIKEGKAKKCIIVTPSLYSPVEGYEINNNSSNITKEFGKELIYDLMPYIAENYNTYAASGSQEDLKANRDHQAYSGLSLGSMTSFDSVLSYCLEYFSYVGSFSGSNFDQASWLAIADQIKANPLKYWYVGCGSLETNKDYPGDPFTAYRTIKEAASLQSGSDLTKGDNCQYVLCNKSQHNYKTWITCLYNSLQVFFK